MKLIRNTIEVNNNENVIWENHTETLKIPGAEDMDITNANDKYTQQMENCCIANSALRRGHAHFQLFRYFWIMNSALRRGHAQF